MLALQPVELRGQRRLGLPRRAPQRALQRPPQVAQAGLQLDGGALARFGGERHVAGHHEQHGEQALDHALVHFAGQVDALLELRARTPWYVA